MLIDLDALESQRTKAAPRPPVGWVCYRCREKCLSMRDLAEHEADHDRLEWRAFTTRTQERRALGLGA